MRNEGLHATPLLDMSFSIRTPEAGRAQVTRTELALARDDGWWEKPVTVEQTQILER